MIEQEILAFLGSKYDPDIVLLGGSRAWGREREDSDWDIYLIGDFEQAARFPQIFQGADLDVAVYPAEAIGYSVFRLYYGPVSKLKVLRDNAKSDGAQIVQETQIAYDRGPEPLTAAEMERMEYGLLRLLAKVKPLLDRPVAAAFLLAEFYREVIPAWFRVRDRWCLPIIQALQEIETQEPEFAALLNEWAEGSDVEQQLAVGYQLVNQLFER